MRLKRLLMANIFIFLPLTAEATSYFTPEDLPRRVQYPSFLQEEIYFVPDKDDTRTINSLTDINNIPVMLITPRLQVKHYNGYDSIHIKLKGYTVAFLENSFFFDMRINFKEKEESDKISIESNGIRFFFNDKNKIVNSDSIESNNIFSSEGNFTSLNRSSIDFNKPSMYHYTITSKKTLPNGFNSLVIERENVTFKGHYEFFYKTPYMKALSGRYIIHVSYDAPSQQNIPQ